METAPSSQDNSEQIHRLMVESATTMASTDYWKLLVKVLVNDEMNCLISLDNYLWEQAHPDREEVMTLCLKWHAIRRQRRLLLDNVREARLKFVPEPPSSEEVETILKEYGEM